MRAPKKPRRTEQKTVFLLFHGGKVALVKRPDTGLLAGLWEFPCTAGHLEEKRATQRLTEQGASLASLSRSVDATHIFTHIEWHMQGYAAVCAREMTHWDGRELVYVTLRELTQDYGVPTAYRAFVRAALDFSPTP